MLNYENVEKVNLQDKFIKDFSCSLNEIKKKYDEIIFLCVGTDRITGDCFGPIVGTKLINLLENYNYSNVNVYGSLENNLSYENINNIMKKIDDTKKSCLIVIDAALSKKENIGKIFISNQKTILGKGLNKDKIQIGDISIKAVVAKDYKIPQYNFKVLQNISLNGVITLADIVARGIWKVIEKM